MRATFIASILTVLLLTGCAPYGVRVSDTGYYAHPNHLGFYGGFNNHSRFRGAHFNRFGNSRFQNRGFRSHSRFGGHRGFHRSRNRGFGHRSFGRRGIRGIRRR